MNFEACRFNFERNENMCPISSDQNVFRLLSQEAWGISLPSPTTHLCLGKAGDSDNNLSWNHYEWFNFCNEVFLHKRWIQLESSSFPQLSNTLVFMRPGMKFGLTSWERFFDIKASECGIHRFWKITVYVQNPNWLLCQFFHSSWISLLLLYRHLKAFSV